MDFALRLISGAIKLLLKGLFTFKGNIFNENHYITFSTGKSKFVN